MSNEIICINFALAIEERETLSTGAQATQVGMRSVLVASLEFGSVVIVQ
jgi:hypothetical protein